LYLRGDLPGASKMYQEALQIQESVEPSSTGYVLYRLADLELSEGRLRDAQRDAQKALEILRPNQGGYQYITGAMLVLAELARTQGDLPGAHRQFEETLAIQQKVGEADLAAETQVELADLAIDEGHSEQAEPLLRPAIAQFEKENSAPDSASAYTILSRALLIQGKVEESRKAIARVAEFTSSDNNPALRLPRDIQKARIEIAELNQTGPSAKSKSAEQELRAAAATAKKLGFFGLECEAKLALGELDAHANPASSRTELAALANNSRSHGFELIARRAEQAASSALTAVATTRPTH
jgi:ATP/maltotriose-dependent transcriptional regulator MalT